MFNILGGDWDPTDKKFSSLASENAEPRSVTLTLCQIVEATSCHMQLRHALLIKSGTRVLEVSQAGCHLQVFKILMTDQDHTSCICIQLQLFFIMEGKPDIAPTLNEGCRTKGHGCWTQGS